MLTPFCKMRIRSPSRPRMIGRPAAGPNYRELTPGVEAKGSPSVGCSFNRRASPLRMLTGCAWSKSVRPKRVEETTTVSMVVGVTSSRSAAKTEQSKTSVKPKKKEEKNFIKKGGCFRIKNKKSQRNAVKVQNRRRTHAKTFGANSSGKRHETRRALGGRVRKFPHGKPSGKSPQNREVSSGKLF